MGSKAIVGKYTFFGDATLDGQVTADDYLVLDAHRNTVPDPKISWISGDMTLDGTVTADDYLVLDANRGLGANDPFAPAGFALLPEPCEIGYLGGLALAIFSRHRRLRQEDFAGAGS